MKKRILYIHGLDSSPRADKSAIMQRYAELLYTPHLFYRRDNTVFSRLLKDAKELEINYIIGSSLGGLMGFWLAQHLEINSLLFNPALPRFKERTDIFPSEKEAPNFFLNIILGKDDEVVPPQASIEYLEKTQYQYELNPNLAHQIDLDTFEKACKKYLSEQNF